MSSAEGGSMSALAEAKAVPTKTGDSPPPHSSSHLSAARPRTWSFVTSGEKGPISQVEGQNHVEWPLTSRVPQMALPQHPNCKVETWSFFGKLIMSYDVLLGHTGERMFCWSGHTKGLLRKEYSDYDPTGSGRGSMGLVCSTSLFLTNDMHVLVRPT